MLPTGTLRALVNMAYEEMENGGHEYDLAKFHHGLWEVDDKSFDNG